jgi:uncharacterized protein (TIGR02145 family)
LRTSFRLLVAATFKFIRAYSFSALPAGYRNNNGYYYSEGDYALFWSSTEYNSNYAFGINLNYNYDGTYLYDRNKSDGFSVRCVKDE